ncbi:MAG TPA: hypothetical protein VL326_34405 [Kofleriaceae bacterium]|jgi:hypothetical protein|nr:hypothetical protein [Kofleriaceae bacterium]
MSLAVIGVEASYEFRWRTWALLRDVIVANLDEATVETFASLGDALVNGSMRVDAKALAADIALIREWLVGKPFEALVIGPRTSAIVHMTSMANTRRPLSRREIENIRPIADSKDLAEYFAVMLDSLERVSGKPQADGTIEVIDG